MASRDASSRRSIWRFAIQRTGRHPIEQRPQVALQQGLLERVLNQFFAVRVDELVQHGQRLLMGSAGKQIRRPAPIKNVQLVEAVMFAVRRRPLEQGFVQPVPEVIRIGVVNSISVRCGRLSRK